MLRKKKIKIHRSLTLAARNAAFGCYEPERKRPCLSRWLCSWRVPYPRDQKEVAVGLVLTGAGGKVLRADTETPLAARPGDLLSRATACEPKLRRFFPVCPTKNIDTLGPAGEVRLDTKQPKVRPERSRTAARRMHPAPKLRIGAASSNTTASP